MHRSFFFILLISAFFLAGCSLRPAEGSFLQTLDQLVQQKNRVNIQGRALSAGEIAFVEAVERLEADYDAWKEVGNRTAAQRKTWKALNERAARLQQQAAELFGTTSPPFSPGR